MKNDTQRSNTTDQPQPEFIGSSSPSTEGAQSSGSGMDFREGKVAKAIEKQTAKLPSDWFLWTACGAAALSATMKMRSRHDDAEFVGLWVPAILMLGLYNKIVKVMGSDQFSSPRQKTQARA